MLRDHWRLHENRATSMLRSEMQFDRFKWWIGWTHDQQIDPELQARFIAEIDREQKAAQDAGRQDLETRFATLCDAFPRRDSKLDQADHAARRALVADLRSLLGKT